MRRVIGILVALAALSAACESVGVGVGIGVPIGSRGGAAISVGGTVPLPKPAQPAASAASAPS